MKRRVVLILLVSVLLSQGVVMADCSPSAFEGISSLSLTAWADIDDGMSISAAEAQDVALSKAYIQLRAKMPRLTVTKADPANPMGDSDALLSVEILIRSTSYGGYYGRIS
jgi:hypothetical protein